MRSAPRGKTMPRPPQLLEKACELHDILKAASPERIAVMMKISPALAQKTHALIATWNPSPENQSLAMDSFIGDIYSGLRAEELSQADRDYADRNLLILSGLYGILRPYDGIFPYRLEMGYKLTGPGFENLYEFWGDSIAECLSQKGAIINLASEEFSRPVIDFVDKNRVVTPQFLTMNQKTGKPSFVAVHSKITRGAFARWMIINKVEDVSELSQFRDLGYKFDKNLSKPAEPTFVCEEFGGKGLSIKMKGKNE